MAPQNTPQPDPLRWAVVTPSYVLDYERCQLLCRSMDAFLEGPWNHYIIVDPVDVPLFAPLAGPRRTVINKKDILPRGFHFGGKVPFMRLGRWWWSFRHGPVFGWQMQQFVKIFMANHVTEEALLFCDSDVFFLKPFNVSTLERQGKIRFNAAETNNWRGNRDVSTSIELLGLNPDDIHIYWGGDQLVTWHRQTVLAMQDFLSRRHNKPWHEAIGMKLNFTEYQLYGTYVLYVQKDNPHIYKDGTIYCKSLWTKEQAATHDVRAFCRDLQPHEAAVCVQSLIGSDMATITAIVNEAIAAK